MEDTQTGDFIFHACKDDFRHMIGSRSACSETKGEEKPGHAVRETEFEKRHCNPHDPASSPLSPSVTATLHLDYNSQPTKPVQSITFLRPWQLTPPWFPHQPGREDSPPYFQV